MFLLRLVLYVVLGYLIFLVCWVVVLWIRIFLWVRDLFVFIGLFLFLGFFLISSVVWVSDFSCGVLIFLFMYERDFEDFFIVLVVIV